MPEVVSANVATLGIILGGREVIFMAFPFVFVLAVWSVVVEVDATSVAPAFPLDSFGTGVGIVGSASAPASASATAWVTGSSG